MDINMGQHERSTNFLIKNVDRPLLYPGARITSSEYQQLAKDLYNLLIKKFQRGNIYSSYRDNIWGAHLADIQLIRKSNKEVRFLQRVFNIYSKYAWNVALKNEKDIKITNAFQKILNKFCRKPKKIWVDQSGEFYKRSAMLWLHKNRTEMYSIHNEGKYFVAERIIRTLKRKVYKHMTVVSKNDTPIN